MSFQSDHRAMSPVVVHAIYHGFRESSSDEVILHLNLAVKVKHVCAS
jgi:hypothetical protein